MPTGVRTDFYPYMLCIRNQDIKVAKGLKPLSKDGVQVIFRFGVSKKVAGEPQHFVGLGDVWDGKDIISGEGDLPSWVELPDLHNQKLHPSDFHDRWKKFGLLNFDFERLTETFLGYPNTGSMEALICDKLLNDFCRSHKVKAEIKVVGNPGQPTTAEVIVRFFHKRKEKFTYIFTLDRPQAEKLFELP